MTRTELYDRVWQTPMRTLAKEFGVSDVALAKLCRKHSVPTPQVGHWMKVAAGKAPVPPQLPAVDGGDEIEMPGGDRTIQAQKGNRVARDPSVVRPSDAFPPPGEVQLRANLAGCHPMIRSTADFFKEKARAVREVELARKRPVIPGQPRFGLMYPRSINGRFDPNAAGCLHVLASVANIDWILRFHDALFRELKRLKALVRPHEGYRRHAAEIVVGDFGLTLSMTEGFAKPEGRTPTAWFIENPYSAKDDYRLELHRRRRTAKVWRASRAQLEGAIGKIAHEIIDIIAEEAAADAVRRREDEARDARQVRQAEEQRARAAERARLDLREAARRAQAGRVLNVGRQQLEYEATLRVLTDLEARFPSGEEGAGLRTWLGVARSGLTPPVDVLLAELQRELAADGGPDWWPVDLTSTERL